MGKNKKSVRAVLDEFTKTFPDLKTNGKVLMCSLCSKEVNHSRLTLVKQHLQTAKHVELVARAREKKDRQQFLFEDDEKQSTFAAELANVFVACDIPLHKSRHPKLTKFLEKHTSEHIPCETKLRQQIPKLFEDLMSSIREQVKNQFLWLSIDETVDSAKRCVVNVVVGILGADHKKFLLRSEILTEVNHSAIVRLFARSMDGLGAGFEKNNVLMLLSDAAPYMVASGNALAPFYPKLIHITCIAHGLHRVCEQIRKEFDDVNELISNVKKVFVKSPYRIRAFREANPDLPLPPEPVITRWGTWLGAALYYADNFEMVANVVHEFLDKHAVAIGLAKQSLNDPKVKRSLALIKENFESLPGIIEKLQCPNLNTAASLELLQEAATLFQNLSEPRLMNVSKKWESVLKKNKGLHTIKSIEKASNMNTLYSNRELAALKFGPLTSVDVERSFSMYKSFNRDNRSSFSDENLT